MALSWIGVFLLLFSGGTLLFTASVPRREVGDRFYRINGYVALFLGVMGGLTSGVFGPRWVDYWPVMGLVAALFAASIAAPAFEFRGTRTLYVGLMAACLVVALAGRKAGFGVGPAIQYALSGYVLGAALVSMLLGHSYLEAGTQSFDLLINACRALLGGLVLRAVVSTACFLPDWGQIDGWMNQDVLLVLFAAVRFGAGLICAGVLAWMALACARIKSNQSATGILYVVTGFVIIGELVAIHLSVAHGVLM
jgi:hypothetical protein